MSTALILPLGVALAWCLARVRWRGKALVETFVALPLVLPPVVTGLVLLKLCGRRGPIGHWLYSAFNIDIVFTWRAVVLALAVMSLPLLVRPARSAIEEVDPALEQIALPPEQVVLLGDTPYDIEAGNRAGVAVIALRCGGWDTEDLAGAVAVYDDPADLLAHFEDSVLA